MDSKSYRGIYVIVTTPFTETFEIDEDSLRATLKFCFDAGVHGVVAPANASEVGYLTDAERRRVAEIVVSEARGKAKAVVGISSNHYRQAAAFAAHAAEIGADAVLAMPPTFHPATPAEIKEYYRQIVAAAPQMPLILQNAIGLGATPMSPAFMAELVAELPTARFVKEETTYSAENAEEIRRLAGDRLIGVMGGRAGKTLLEEVPRGICGTMPACEFADVHVALWKAIEAGETERSRDIFPRLLPLLDFESTYGIPLCKEVLKARGVVPSSRWRQSGYRPLDKLALDEMATLLDSVRDLMLPDYRHR